MISHRGFWVAAAALLSGLAMLATAATAAPAHPATPPEPIPAAIAADAAEVDGAESDLRQITTALKGRSLDDDALRGMIAATPAIRARLAHALGALTPLLTDANQRLDQLGSPPGPGALPEDPEITHARNDLLSFKRAVSTEFIQANLLSVETEQTLNALEARRRQLFSSSLARRDRSLFDTRLWSDAAAQAPGDAQRIGAALAEEAYQVRAATADPGVRLRLWLSLAAGLLLLGPARILLDLAGRRWARLDRPPSPLRRVALAAWRVGTAAGTPWLAVAVAGWGLETSGALTPVLAPVPALLAQTAAFAGLLQGLGGLIQSAGGGTAWRLVPVSDATARRLRAAPWAIALASGATALLAGFGSILGVSFTVSVAGDSLCVGAELLLIAAILSAIGADRAEAHGSRHAAAPSQPRHLSDGTWVVIALAAWLALAAALFGLVAGYLAFAAFVTREIVWIAAILGVSYLLIQLTDHVFAALLSPDWPLGRFGRLAVGLHAQALEQLGILAAGLVRVAIILVAWVAVLAPFGTTPADLVARVTSTSMVIRFGQVTLEPGAILGGIGVFVAGVLATRAVRRWLESRYLPTTGMDVGLRASLASGVTYLGAVVALVLASGYLGLSFDRIALFASALSVGVGFGLQSVIGNFVSGLILMAERPVKVGDWIALGDLEGDVRRISVRATEIEMPDRSRLIVPNSDLISRTVRNVTHAGSLGRVKIALTVAHGADPSVVRDVLLAQITAHAEVLEEPAPAVYLTEARASGLEFTAFAYVASPRVVFRIRSELLYQLIPALTARGVALAADQPVVRISLPDGAGPAA